MIKSTQRTVHLTILHYGVYGQSASEKGNHFTTILEHEEVYQHLFVAGEQSMSIWAMKSMNQWFGVSDIFSGSILNIDIDMSRVNSKPGVKRRSRLLVNVLTLNVMKFLDFGNRV